MVQVKYRLLHEVNGTWRCIDGLSDLQITACSTVQMAGYYVSSDLQISARITMHWRYINGLSDLQITACNTVQLAVY